MCDPNAAGGQQSYGQPRGQNYGPPGNKRGYMPNTQAYGGYNAYQKQGGNNMMPVGTSDQPYGGGTPNAFGQGPQQYANANEYGAAQPQIAGPTYMDGPNPDGSGGYGPPPQVSGPNYMDGPGPGGGGYQLPGSQYPRGRGPEGMPRSQGGGGSYMPGADMGRSPDNPTAGVQDPSSPGGGVMNNDLFGGGTPVPKVGQQPGPSNMFEGDTNPFNPNKGVSDIYARYGVQDMVGHGGKWWDNAIKTGQAKTSDLETALQKEGFKMGAAGPAWVPPRPYTPPQVGPMPRGSPVPLAPANMPQNMGWWGQAGANPLWQQILDGRGDWTYNRG